MTIRAHRWRWPCLAVAAILSTGACGGGSSTAGSSPSKGSTVTVPAGVAAFRVIKPDGTTVPFTIAALRKLPLVSILSHGQPQEGPSVLSVLNAAGVTNFASITVTGGNGKKTLTQAQVTKDVILDYNNRGSVKLVSPAWAKPQRITDVVKIEVTS